MVGDPTKDEDSDTSGGVEATRRRSAELFAAAARRRRGGVDPRRGPGGTGPPAPAAGGALRAAVPQPRRALRGPGPGRHDRAAQVDRPVRPRARGRVLDVRHPDDHRRDQAVLPRQGLGDPGAAPAAGAAHADRRDQCRADPEPGSLPHRRASSPKRSAARSRRSSRGSSRATPTRRCRSTPATATTTARRPCSTPSASRTRTSSTSRSGSRSSPCSTGSDAAGEADPAAALLQEHDPVADRRGDRRLPDARLPAAHAHPGAAADLARGGATVEA